jgi:hypothetical protein
MEAAIQDIPLGNQAHAAASQKGVWVGIQSCNSRLSDTKGLTIVESRSPIDSASCVASLAGPLLP